MYAILRLTQILPCACTGSAKPSHSIHSQRTTDISQVDATVKGTVMDGFPIAFGSVTDFDLMKLDTRFDRGSLQSTGSDRDISGPKNHTRDRASLDGEASPGSSPHCKRQRPSCVQSA